MGEWDQGLPDEAGGGQVRTALEAIVARLNGDWDHPSLMKQGALGVSDYADCIAIAERALARADALPELVAVLKDMVDGLEDRPELNEHAVASEFSLGLLRRAQAAIKLAEEPSDPGCPRCGYPSGLVCHGCGYIRNSQEAE